MKKLMNNQKGVALLEFAILLPLLVLLVFGTIETALLFYNKQVLTNATREGARCGIDTYHEYTAENIETIVSTYCDNMILLDLKDGAGTLTVAPPVYETDTSGDTYVRIHATYEYHFLFASLLGFSTTDIAAETTMRRPQEDSS